jgi:hypothetical protein
MSTKKNYSLNDEKTQATSTAKKMDVGIKEAVHLTKLDYNAEEGYVSLEFTNDQKQYIDKRLWAPEGKYPKPDQTQEEAADSEAYENLKVLRILMETLYPEIPLVSLTGTYSEICTKVVETLKSKLNAGKFNLKITYDKSGQWPELSKYGFIEKHVEGEPSSLYFSKWELENRMTKAETKKDYRDKGVDDLEALLSGTELPF